MNTKATRRKKSSLTEVKVAVIGAPGVGKSGKKKIFTETRYKHEVLVDGEPVLYEILDTCPKNEDDLPSSEIINWADGLLFVYSITNRRSFTFLKRVGTLIADSDIPVYIVGNKNDMVHLREVSAEEGAMLARDFECGFSEVAAAEQVAPVAVVFQEICRAVLAARRKSKHSLLERMLGSRTSNLRLYVRGKSDSALPKD
nr:PREDICTED: ras-related and estrogen-regulated growth inhibitor-like protein [Tribolium castaneum]|eukprot:XP_015840087.1 PREDICTED: ras-related and estrogen-regulated growth inhibitor-like protein [Tribolium castaneum]